MQLFRREWKSYAKSTILWSIGMCLLIIIAFYKVDGLRNVEGGMNAMIQALPPALQTIFGISSNYDTGIALYGVIHVYILVALSFHAVLLGASLFAKEEHDKTFEFLYIKGMKRNTILSMKIAAGTSIMLLLNTICIIITMLSLYVLQKTTYVHRTVALYIGSYDYAVILFFLYLLLTFLLPNNRKAGMAGCSFILIMFLTTMYAKLGGNVNFLNHLSLFYYMDANTLKNGLDLLSSVIIFLISIACLGISYQLHEHRDLL